MRELLSDPKRWTKRWFAFDESGNRSSPMSQNAQCFCLLGAVHRVARCRPCLADSSPVSTRAVHFLETVTEAKYGVAVATFNDLPGIAHQDVLAVIDRAIFKAGGGDS